MVLFPHSGHGDELPFVFHNLNGSATAQEVTLSDEMVSYWTSFAKYGDPNNKQQSNWPEYSVADSINIKFDTPVNVVSKLF